jgi:hypothetical protein
VKGWIAWEGGGGDNAIVAFGQLIEG